MAVLLGILFSLPIPRHKSEVDLVLLEILHLPVAAHSLSPEISKMRTAAAASAFLVMQIIFISLSRAFYDRTRESVPWRGEFCYCDQSLASSFLTRDQIGLYSHGKESLV